MIGWIILFIITGVYTGLIIGYLIKDEGVSVNVNVLSGMITALLCGFIGMMFGFGSGLFFAFAGSLASLFIINVFHQHHIEDLPPVHPYDS